MQAIKFNPVPSEELIAELNTLLGTLQVFKTYVKGAHWNVEGDVFFELHEVLEQLYQDLEKDSDYIAELIRTFGQIPVHTLEQFLKVSSLKEYSNHTSGNIIVKHVIQGLERILEIAFSTAKIDEQTSDKATYHWLMDFILRYRKWLWMFRSYSKSANS